MRFSVQFALIAALSAMAAPALAHPKLVAASPAADAAARGVTRITLSFSETLTPKLSGATLTMTGMPGAAHHPDMKMNDVKVAIAGKAIALTSPKPLPAGSYRVDWRIVGGDMHRITGQHSFTVR